MAQTPSQNLRLNLLGDWTRLEGLMGSERKMFIFFGGLFKPTGCVIAKFILFNPCCTATAGTEGAFLQQRRGTRKAVTTDRLASASVHEPAGGAVLFYTCSCSVRLRWELGEPAGFKGRKIGNFLPNNQRQRHTCYALCHYCTPCRPLLQAFSGRILTPPPTDCRIQREGFVDLGFQGDT
jgi:hypothetical protein